MRGNAFGSWLVRVALVGLVVALAASGAGRTEAPRVVIDPLLDRIMRDADVPAGEAEGSEATPGERIDFFARLTPITTESDVPAVRVRLALDAAAREAIEAMGIPTYGRLDGFASALVPTDRLSEIAALPGLERMQAMRIPILETDVSRGDVRSTDLAATYGAGGRGVVVAVIDTGIDWRHADFRNPDGTTRIKYLWNQDDSCVGPPPPAPFSFGCLYTEPAINAALAGSLTITAPDADGHGTHVMAVAAGNGRATGIGWPAQRYVGMAPEADLIVVKTFPEPNDLNGCATCYDTGAALDFVDAMAGALGEPYVVNLSYGSQFGGHDGGDLDERTIDVLTGPGKPGKVVVKSAGNERGHAIHIGGTVAAGQSNTHVLNIPTYTAQAGSFNDVVAWSLWYNAGDNLTVTIADPPVAPCGSTTLTLSATTGQGIVASPTTSGTMIIDDSSSPAANGARFFEMEIDDQAGVAPCRGSWQLRVRGNTITTGGRYDAWIWFSSFGAAHAEALWTIPDNSRVISVPGTAFNVTTVGAYISKLFWRSVDGNTYIFAYPGSPPAQSLAPFSSPGPTRDGRIKPDLNAPGSAIVSALSNDARPTTDPPLIVEDGVHWSLPGTSFSAPHVAGVYAQLLGLKPHLDAIQLRTLVTSTARFDPFVSLPIPNNNWGTGKLSALAAAQALCTAEICNGLDDDCDGATDEDLGTLTCGSGICERTVPACVGGAGQTCVPGPAASESCNELDDDCDGATDDGFGAPTLVLGLSPDRLWPPNHRMVAVHATVFVEGGCFYPGASPAVVLNGVSSSEPDDAQGGGDGTTTDDVQEADIGQADLDIALRAERDGGGAGRQYAVTYSVADSTGQVGNATAVVHVPHDEGGAEEPIVLSVAEPEAGTLIAWDAAVGAARYHLVRGEVDRLRETGSAIDLGPVTCLMSGSAAPSSLGHEDDVVPPLGKAFFYLVAYDDGATSVGYGTARAHKPRIAGAGDCP